MIITAYLLQPFYHHWRLPRSMLTARFAYPYGTHWSIRFAELSFPKDLSCRVAGQSRSCQEDHWQFQNQRLDTLLLSRNAMQIPTNAWFDGRWITLQLGPLGWLLQFVQFMHLDRVSNKSYLYCHLGPTMQLQINTRQHTYAYSNKCTPLSLNECCCPSCSLVMGPATICLLQLSVRLPFRKTLLDPRGPRASSAILANPKHLRPQHSDIPDILLD
jgi:hypothetical protein